MLSTRHWDVVGGFLDFQWSKIQRLANDEVKAKISSGLEFNWDQIFGTPNIRIILKQ